MQENEFRIRASSLRAAMALAPFDGRGAQEPMEPAWRGAPPLQVRDGEPRRAAALAYVYELEGALHLPLTVRSDHLREHRGQVSLPGGRPEGVETSIETARREAYEEVGIARGAGEVLGSLAPVYIPVTHTTLRVHVAMGPAPKALVPEPGEVAEIVVVPLGDLVDPRRHKRRVVETHGRQVDVPYLDVGGVFLWGATAMALHELVARLREVT